MRVEFSIRASSAVACGLREHVEWQRWAESPSPSVPGGELGLDLSHVPAMARRRLGRLAKMAVLVADDVLQREQLEDLPVVWTSRYGDAEKSLALLRSQVAGEPLSPTAFGLSVHNGVGAQHSILRGMVANAICVASSGSVPEAGVVEALGLMADGASDVLLVCYDEPLPGEYAGFSESTPSEFAWAALLTGKSDGVPSFALSASASAPPDCDVTSLPHGLRVLQFLLAADQPGLTHARGEGGSWIWERLHA
ncbi:beta-ketoacyl synthase chain length factor [Diaphorobacter caeni]|uniref:beta-ketoacyl synthase chain length factor n=1 Tax=Diaphorobacter caeni TaxID=2784387 RepID=UPI00188F8FAE|nr:beta-ketoacyl synthase chain length factor [Diaphorobacter caeni]MBF5006432.1 beta-ketoacyl synthase chain length factor [Diaphorobacter caeni]